jgi:hypothetical protein
MDDRLWNNGRKLVSKHFQERSSVVVSHIKKILPLELNRSLGWIAQPK